MSTVPLGGLGAGAGELKQRRRLVALPGTGRSISSTPSSARSVAATRHLGARSVRRLLAVSCDAAAAVGALALVQGTAGITLSAAVVLPVLWTVLLVATRAREPRGTRFGLEDVRRIGRAGVALALVGWAGLSLLPAALSSTVVPSADVLTLAVAATAVTVGVRAVVDTAAFRLRGSDGAHTRVIVAGSPGDVSRVVAALRRTPGHGFEVVATCLTATPQEARDGSVHPSAQEAWDLPVTIGVEALDAVVDAHAAQGVIVLPCPELGADTVRRIGWQLEESGRHLFVAPGLVDVDASRTSLAPVGGLPLVHVRHAELAGVRRWAKACLDRLAALCALALAAPLLLALAAAVKWDSPGPAFFRQVRIGRDGRPFEMLKLRTMSTDAEVHLAGLRERDEGSGVLFKMRVDPRVTRVGRVLRTYSLDELPQLLNVVRGEMSLVGPRPPLPGEAAAYEGDTHRRLAVKPGLTGLWQVSGRSDLPWDEAVRLDLSYVENWSLALDARIVYRTLGAVLTHRGAY